MNEKIVPNLTQTSCKRCKNNIATLKLRSDDVCEKCFTTYITTKAIKRMEKYRVRGPIPQTPKKLLLPLSYGPGSASLLHILDAHLQAQYSRINKVTYELIVVHIDMFVELADREYSAQKLENFRSRFPRHKYISCGLEESLNLGEVNLATLGMRKLLPDESPTEQLRKYLMSLTSPTDRADIISILLVRMLAYIGKSNECDSILFGDSTTKLAEKSLTNIAKGRGIALPLQIRDGTCAYGIEFNYPMRDILKKEIIIFSSLCLSLKDLIIYDKKNPVTLNSKSVTINDLMLQYFQTVEEDYPSIMTNVVKTVSKLSLEASIAQKCCKICALPLCTNKTPKIFSDEVSDNTISTDQLDLENQYCYACSKLLLMNT